MVKELEGDRLLVQETKGLAGYYKRYVFSKKLRVLETKALTAETEFKKLSDMAKYAEKVEPLVYVGKLILGILAALLSLNWLLLYIIHAFASILGNEESNGWHKYDYINALAKSLGTTTDGKTFETASFAKFLLIDAYFMVTTIYLLNCTIKGNDTYGQRFAAPTFFPVT
jgi:hypothetical protein